MSPTTRSVNLVILLLAFLPWQSAIDVLKNTLKAGDKSSLSGGVLRPPTHGTQLLGVTLTICVRSNFAIFEGIDNGRTVIVEIGESGARTPFFLAASRFPASNCIFGHPLTNASHRYSSQITSC